MAKVRTECNKVASLSVFQVPVSKSMKLEEFEQTQAQVSTQVGANIKIYEKIASFGLEIAWSPFKKLSQH